MKIKLKLLTFIFLIIIINNSLKAEIIFFESKNLKIENEGKMIFALKGKAKIPAEKISIQGDKSIYNKEISGCI